MELMKDKLVLEHRHQIDLLEAASFTLAKRNIYRYATTEKKTNMLTAQWLTARKLLDIHGELFGFEGAEFNKEYFKSFLKEVQNKRLYTQYMIEIENMHKKIAKGKYPNEYIMGAYTMVQTSAVIARAVERSQLKNNIFDVKIYLDQTFNIIQNMSFGIANTTRLAFYATPSQFVHNCKAVKSAEDKMLAEKEIKMVIIQAHLAIAFLDKDKLEDYLEAINITNDMESRSEIISRLHEFNIGRKTIYIHRIHEIYNMMEEFLAVDRNGFDKVLKSIIKSITHCRKEGITSFLQITNVIMNNLLAAAFKHPKIRKEKEIILTKMIIFSGKKDSNILPLIKSIGEYIDGYYSNKHERLCAYSIDTAIKQALATMCKYEPDLFSKTKGGNHDKR